MQISQTHILCGNKCLHWENLPFWEIIYGINRLFYKIRIAPCLPLCSITFSFNSAAQQSWVFMRFFCFMRLKMFSIGLDTNSIGTEPPYHLIWNLKWFLTSLFQRNTFLPKLPFLLKTILNLNSSDPPKVFQFISFHLNLVLSQRRW